MNQSTFIFLKYFKGAGEKLEVIRQYRSKVEKELHEICADILNVLDNHLIPSATTGESKVFYQKMKGDYNRYLAEFASGDDRKAAADNALAAYRWVLEKIIVYSI